MASISYLRPAGRSLDNRLDASPRRGRPRLAARLGALGASAALALGALAAPALAAGTLTLTTPYPAVVVAPGAHVTFNIDVKTDTSDRVALSMTGAPASWKASLHGGGFVVDAVQTNGTDAATVRLDLDVPADATGTTRIAVRGEAGSAVASLALDIRVDQAATGAITIKNDIPALRGPSTQSFSFSLTVQNDTTEDQTYSATGAGPTGWTVNTTLTGQSQAASAIVKAGSTAGITVAVDPPADVDAGKYTMQVATSVGGQTLVNDLQVEITGSYSLSIATGDGRLNGHGAAGSTAPLAVTVTNSGTAAISNVKLTATAPTGWDVTFDSDTIASLDPNTPVTVNAQIKPSGDAIAGDYNVTITAAGDQSTRDSMDIRFTVETSLLWGLIGAALIVVVVAGVWWVFQRYGRR